MLKEVTATLYITPLREGGSLPGPVEADDPGTYVQWRAPVRMRRHVAASVGRRGGRAKGVVRAGR